MPAAAAAGEAAAEAAAAVEAVAAVAVAAEAAAEAAETTAAKNENSPIHIAGPFGVSLCFPEATYKMTPFSLIRQ